MVRTINRLFATRASVQEECKCKVCAPHPRALSSLMTKDTFHANAAFVFFSRALPLHEAPWELEETIKTKPETRPVQALKFSLITFALDGKWMLADRRFADFQHSSAGTLDWTYIPYRATVVCWRRQSARSPGSPAACASCAGCRSR